MGETVVIVKFPNMETNYYAVYRGYDGKILEWKDLDDLIPKESRTNLSEDTRKQMENRCDGTALFDTEEEIRKVMEVISYS